MLVNISFWQEKMFYQKKHLLEKAAMMKRVGFLSFGKEIKAQPYIVKKSSIINETILMGLLEMKRNLIYNSKHSFFEHYNNKLFNSRSSLESIYPFFSLVL